MQSRPPHSPQSSHPAASPNQQSAVTKPWESAKAGEGSQLDPLAARFVESLSYDTRLYAADIRGSIAHARMLLHIGLLSTHELAEIERGLGEIRAEIETAPAGPSAVGVPGAWPGWKVELEDVHMCVEAALVEKIGDPGRKLHTGRSRNDQVALDLRLWLRDACGELGTHLDTLRVSLVNLAKSQGDIVIPSYTHMQRAQPSCVGAEAMAWWAMFDRDRAFLSRLAEDPLGIGQSPLGSGAIAGSLLPLDRAHTASALGFAGGPSISSIDATASRDEALDFAYALSRIALHLSRLAEQWILYCTTEFGFVALGSAYTTGSSMMPQKRNPDMLELIRGRAGNAVGSLVSLLTIVKGLPIGYNRDLQEDKRHVFALFDTVRDGVEMMARIVASARFDAAKIAAAGGGLDRGYLDATALAEFLVSPPTKDGSSHAVPFRTAHQIAGALVRLADSTGRHSLAQLTLDEFNQMLKEHGQRLTVGPEVYGCLGAEGVARHYRSAGNAGIGPLGYRAWLTSLGETVVPTSTATCSTNAVAMTDPKPTASESASVAATHAPHTSAHITATTATPQTDLFGSSSADDADTGNAGYSRPRTGSGNSAADEALIAAYAHAGRSLDDLPYTREFEALHASVRSAYPEFDSPRALLHRLHNLRKAGKLPKLVKTAGGAGGAGGTAQASSPPPRIAPENEQLLAELVIEFTGTLGQRDRLPYDERFEMVVTEFNQRTGRMLSPHDVWRLVAKLAK